LFEWSRAEYIAALAFLVSAGSAVLSFLTYRRTRRAETPHAWAEVEGIGLSDCWRLSIYLANPTKHVLKIGKVSVPIRRVPVDDKQDFLLGDYTGALSAVGGDIAMLHETAAAAGRFFSNIADGEAIEPDATGVVRYLLFRGRFSTAPKVKLSVSFRSMQERPVTFTRTLSGDIPAPGLTIHLKRV